MINWQRIRTVFLDMDGTLLDLNFDNHFWQSFVPQRYSEKQGISLEQARAELVPRFKSMEGKLEWYCLDYWSEALQLDIVAMKQEVAGLIAILPHVVEFLERVRASGRRLVLVTNAHPRSLELKLEKTCLHLFFDAIISSHTLGLPKESVDFWQRLRQQEAYEPETTLMVDDSLPVLSAASEYGLGYCVAVRSPLAMTVGTQNFPAISDFRELMPPLPEAG